MVKAISLWQIHASLVALGEKKWETRTKPIRYRGPLVIHAARSKIGIKQHHEDLFNVFQMGEDLAFYPLLKYTLPLLQSGKLPANLNRLPFGAALCVVDVTDCVPTCEIRDSLSSQERAFGGYDIGRYAWKLENLRTFKTPIPMKGWQFLFDCDLDLERIAYQ